jgi:hypothetical protein
VSTSKQFKRTYELLIGEANGSSGLKLVGNEDTSEGLQLQFDIKKNIDNKEQSNSCNLKLTNLSEASINPIRKRNSAVILKVGYNGNNKVLFSGMNSELETDDSGSSDKITSIKCVPADNLYYSPTISRTFPAGTTPRDIISFLIGQSTVLSRASFNSKNIDVKFPFGYPAEGSVQDVMSELSRDFDFNYRIDGSRIYVNDPNRYQSPSSIERAFVISPNTGLIGTPTFATADGSKNDKDSTAKDGVKFKALLNPLLQPGQAVQIKDTTITGTYRINTAEYKGDWRGSAWEVTCHCAKIIGEEV